MGPGGIIEPFDPTMHGPSISIASTRASRRDVHEAKRTLTAAADLEQGSAVRADAATAHRGGAVFLPNTRHGWCLMLVLALTLLGCIFKEDFAHGPALLAHGMHHGADAAALKGTCAAPPPQLPFRLQVSCR